VPTISDLKDQARNLEQQGQLDKALTIYQHILKHLEGTPAVMKVLPLYVKAGDLQHKIGRHAEAVASYQTAAEHYAASGAAPRVTALCGKILRLVPERRDVYTDFVRQLIDHGHVGSARDVLADYARYAGMDRATETLDDLAGRPNHEVQPMLERLLESFELEGQENQSEQTAVRVSSQLEQVTDSLAGELSWVPETTAETVAAPAEEDVAEEEEDEPVSEAGADESEPLTPPMFDLDHLPRQSSMHKALRLEDDDEDSPEVEEASGIEITADVTPTMEGISPVTDAVDESPIYHGSAFVEPEESADDLDSLLANAIATEDSAATADSALTPGAVEIEGSEWKPDFSAPQPEDTVAAQWAQEEELQPAARYPSDKYDTPDTDDESDEDVGEDAGTAAADAFEDEISRAVEEEPPAFVPQAEPEAPTEPERRPSRPPRMTVPDASVAKSKSPILFGIAGLVVGALAGAGLTFVLVGGGSNDPPTMSPVERPAAVVDTAPAAAEPGPEVATPVTTNPLTTVTPAIDTTAETPTDSAAPVEAAAGRPEEASPNSTPVANEQPAETVVPNGNPIVVEGLAIEEISEIEYRGLAGYRVVHLLDWGDPIVIEAYRDTTVTLSTRIQVDVTPPDTVVGIARLDGYMVYASGVMPEDSLRSLMSRLVVGERQN
jgi:hypothetical protein